VSQLLDLTDMTSVTDSGTMTRPLYASGDYFLEDYTATSQSFT
jgi:hypothetical protein